MIKELIDQIGGRERLECIAENAISMERIIMARALLAVLDAHSNPVAYLICDKEDRKDGRLGTLSFTGAGSYSDDDINEYELCDTPLYTVPPEASVPDGWKLVPIEPNWSMLNAAINFHEGEAFLPASLYKAMLASFPAPENKK